MKHHFQRKDVREAAEWCYALGFEYVGHSGGHPSFTHPEFGKIQMPWSPSRSWHDVFRQQLASRAGMTKRQLEVRLGMRQEKRRGPRRRRQVNEAGRRARTFSVERESTPPPERVGTVRERMAEIAEEIGSATQGLKTAVGDDYASLLGELSRLRGEYCQLEHDHKGVTA